MRNMLTRFMAGCVAVMSLLVPTTSSAETVKPFQNGDRVAFIGDSITAWGAYAYVVSAFYQTRFPNRKIHWGYFGRGGATAEFWSHEAGPQDPHPEWANLEQVLKFRPTVATIMLGMNDSAYDNVWFLPEEQKSSALAEVKAKYEKNMDLLIARLQSVGIKRIILIISSPYDETQVTDTKPNPLVGKNAFMRDVIGDYLIRKSKELGEPVIDFMTPMLKINQREQKIDAKFSVVDMGDRIHPLGVGHFIMGYTFLKAQGLEGRVAETVISASHAKVVTQRNCEIKGLDVSEGSITWTCLADSLPFPQGVPPYADYAAKHGAAWAHYVPFDEEFNRELLRITGLAAGNYALMIDGTEVGKYTNSEIDKGINLADNYVTPQNKQASSVNSYCVNESDYAPNSAYGYWAHKWNDDLRTNLTYRALQPAQRKYELVKVD
ncbi:MAG: SGNH/GDSL hydrolase family protein [Armatimonadota bacterium]